MKDRTLQKVSKFHEAMGINISDTPSIPLMGDREAEILLMFSRQMADIAANLMTFSHWYGGSVPMLRAHLLAEETAELMEAMANNDIAGCLDGLCDIRYVQDGAVLALGLQHHFDDGFDEVDRTNMAKLDTDGRPVKNAAGRIIKPAGWTPPDLHTILNIEREQNEQA